MRDVGLMTGVKALWQEDLLWDYTIKVQGEEFKAHKVVLASVSQYFKAMLSEGFMESKTDEVELKGLVADMLSKVLEFIYTGDEGIIGTDALEVLKCAMYLQMPLVADVCVEKLLEGLDYRNCLGLYSVFVECSLRGAVETIENFIKIKWKKVLELCNLKEISLGGLEVLKKYWKKSEWELFLFIKNWFEADPEKRMDDVSELLNDVRFCLINPQRLTSITEMGVLTDVAGSWHDLVEQALRYHQLPTHLKVLHQSDQSKVRTEPTAFFFTTEDPSTFFALDKKNKWKKYDKKAQNAPESGEFAVFREHIGIEVNNYFIIWTGDRTQKWHIFDPRTLKWSKMADMGKRKDGFVLVHHGEYLYAVGEYNQQHNSVPNFEMERYSFRENSWSSIAVPYYFMDIGACVIGDSIYVCGGTIQDVNGVKTSRSVYSLDLSSPSREWERKATLTLWESLAGHKVFVVHIDGEDVMLAVVEDLYMYFYSPTKDKWTYFGYTGEKKYQDSGYIIDGMILVRENYLYVLKVMLLTGSDHQYDFEQWYMEDRICLKWKIPKSGWHITNVPMENFPLSVRPSRESEVKIFSAILAIPQ